MRLAGIIFSAIFAIIAVPLFTMAACNLSVESAFLSRTTYDGVLEDDVLFQNLLTDALPVILTSPGAATIEFEGRQESPILFRDLVSALQDKPAIWEEVTNLLVPPQWIQGTVTDFVDVLFAVSKGNLEAINNTIDVSDLRQRFTGDEAAQAARLIISEAPACTEEQLAALDTFFSESKGIMPICNPSDVQIQESSIHVLDLWFAALATHLTVDQPKVSDIFGITTDDARTVNLLTELEKQGLILTYFCPLAFLSFIVILAVRSRKSFGRWIGITSISSGIVVLITIIALQVMVFGIVTRALSADTPAQQFLARLVSEILHSVIAQSSSSMLIQAAVFIGIGFILLVIGGFSGEQSENLGSSVLITEDGQIISTATRKHIGTIAEEDD